MSSNKRTITVDLSGFAPLPVLGVVFVILKLTHYIEWSWLWVLAPFWIPFGIFISCLIFFGAVYLLVHRK